MCVSHQARFLVIAAPRPSGYQTWIDPGGINRGALFWCRLARCCAPPVATLGTPAHPDSVSRLFSIDMFVIRLGECWPSCRMLNGPSEGLAQPCEANRT